MPFTLTTNLPPVAAASITTAYVVCIGADLLSEEQIRSIVEIFLATSVEDGRHTRRIQKIDQIETDEAGWDAGK